MRVDLLKKLKEDSETLSIWELHKLIGLPYNTLYKIIREQRIGRVTTWDVIDKYYRHRRKKS